MTHIPDQPETQITVDDGPFEVDHVALGHWTHPDGLTGCTVLIADSLVPAAIDVRGGAPGTRETALLAGGRTVQGVDAILLTGGSAFGLAAADGVVQWLRERNRGFPTPAINVPIVSGAVIFDLNAERPIWPDADAGNSAASNASNTWSSGRFGGGAGASVSKALGRERAIRSGIGVAQVGCPSGRVSAVFVNNAFGDILNDRFGELLTTPGNGSQTSEEILISRDVHAGEGQNTVLGAIVVDRPLDHDALSRLTIAGHSGLARVVRPASTPVDGDTIFAMASGSGSCSTAELMQLTIAAQVASARAIVNSVRD